MVEMVRRIRRVLSILLILLVMFGAFAGASATTDELGDDGLKAYNLICELVDQGDAKAAVNVLMETPAAEEVYARLSAEEPGLLESILVDAVCFYNEYAELFNIVDLRLKGFFSDEMFLGYWERVGMEIPAAIAEEANQSSYDVFLFHELLMWYERGAEANADIIDLRYLGMINDEMYSALVEQWNVDPMDHVDFSAYIPLYGMRLSEDEKEQIRKWQMYVDEGESREVAEMILNGDISENVHRWLRKSEENLFDLILAQAMFEFALDGYYEQNMRLILAGFVSDACFERYWSLLEFVPVEYARSNEDYQDTDMYFVYEIERICTQTDNELSLLQWLWNANLIDEYTLDMLVGRVGGWESDVLEIAND